MAEQFTQPLFQSFFIGGFECATHRRRDRTRMDVLSATRHDKSCKDDYRLLSRAGIHCVRDGLRWHRIDTTLGYDWASFLPMLHASYVSGVQVIWDLCHWGVPDGLDIFSDDFPVRFARFAAAAAQLISEENLKAGLSRPQIYCAINEISFWSWVGGDIEHFYPFGKDRGPELKRQLVRASIAAIRAVKTVDPQARFLQAEPIINISADDQKPEDKEAASRHTSSQFEAWDMLAGRLDPELGGAADTLDMIGVNYYWNNQWVHEGDRTPPGHSKHKPLHRILEELWARYRRPIVISETGTEESAEIGWLGYLMAEVRQARRLDVPLLGVCLYPVMDYPGWDDLRHCPCGLIEVDESWKTRRLRKYLCEEVRIQQATLEL